jgi:hypothetical protein
MLVPNTLRSRLLGVFIETSWCIRHRGVETPRCLHHKFHHRGVETPWFIHHQAVVFFRHRGVVLDTGESFWTPGSRVGHRGVV